MINLVKRMCILRNSQGYSLVELSLVLVILGMVLTLAVQLLPKLTQQTVRQAFDVQARAINHAIVGFTMVQSRLPCPDTTGNGLENCTVNNVGGLLPYKTLGLAVTSIDRLHKNIRYAAYQSANATTSKDPAVLSPPLWLEADKDLSQVVQRYVPLLPATDANGVVISALPFQNNNGLDLCYALRNSSIAMGSNILVHADDGSVRRNMAYAFASSGLSDADGDGNAFDGRNRLGQNIFDSPNRQVSDQYDDVVYAVSSETLLGQLMCSPSLSALHAQADVTIASLHSVVALQDAKTNADIALSSAKADVAAGVAAGLMAAAAVSSAAAEILVATSEAVQTFGGMSFAIALGIAGAATAALAVASAVLLNINISTSLASANATVTAAASMVTKSKLLPPIMIGHVSRADQQGVYGW